MGNYTDEEIQAWRDADQKRFDNWPDWANYRATDANGAVYFWSEKPDAWGTMWHKANVRHEPNTTVVSNWRDTLEERP